MTTLQIFLALGALGALFIAIRVHTRSLVSRRFQSLVFRLAVADATLRLKFIFNRQMSAYVRYTVAVKGLDRAVGLRDAFDQSYVMRQSPEMGAAIRQSSEYADVIRYYERKLAGCVAYFASMSEADIWEIATLFAETYLENLVAPESVADFFRGERDMIVATPHLAVGHMERSGTRMRELHTQALALNK